VLEPPHTELAIDPVFLFFFITFFSSEEALDYRQILDLSSKHSLSWFIDCHENKILPYPRISTYSLYNGAHSLRVVV
jgi:hypothetical protein